MHLAILWPYHCEYLTIQSSVGVQNYLDSSGNWGRMDMKRCDAFLDWLSEAGLLTDGIPSRTQGPDTVSLDDLREGNAGQQIPRSQIAAADLFTSQFLP